MNSCGRRDAHLRPDGAGALRAPSCSARRSPGPGLEALPRLGFKPFQIFSTDISKFSSSIVISNGRNVVTCQGAPSPARRALSLARKHTTHLQYKCYHTVRPSVVPITFQPHTGTNLYLPMSFCGQAPPTQCLRMVADEIMLS